jgi:predicted CxxxxCH...CXXCH cytochrome family protein
VDDALAYANSMVHAGGLLDPLSTDFHGQLVQDRGWNLSFCASCHGSDFSGGAAGASCNGCHVGGPTGCSTCHGMPPLTGAHVAHATGPRLGRKLDCSECHLKPAVWDAPGHIYDENGALLPPPAVVTFGALAATSTPSRSAPPTWSGTTCDNVYCHGGAFDDAAARQTHPSWSGGPSDAACGTCHGVPPSGHPGGTCSTCHGAVVDEQLNLIAPDAHVVGRVSLGADGSGSCTSCHPAPGGAHAAHTQATHELAAPIACTECHVVPATIDAPGHLSASGEAAVFPPGGIGAIASAGGALPSFDPASTTCADVHCHGGGDALAADQAMGLQRMPSWGDDADVISCGSCHGVPPIDGLHDVRWTLTTCASCHPKTIDPSGAIIGGAGSTHINGTVDVQ